MPEEKPEKLIFPDDWSEEDKFAFEKCYFRVHRHESWDDVFCFPRSYIKAIRQHWPEAPHGPPDVDASVSIIEAVEELGIAAIHFDKVYAQSPPYAGPLVKYSPSIQITAGWAFKPQSTFPRPVGFSEPGPDWQELNQLVGTAISQWQCAVNQGRTRPFLRLLKEIGKALVPHAKGKGKKRGAGNNAAVRFWYYKMLFRVTKTAHILKTPGRPVGSRIKFASEQYGLSVEDIKHFWRIDEDNSPIGRPLSLKEMARILTAKRFGITQHRISNILAW